MSEMNELQGLKFESAPDLETAMRAFTAATQDDNTESAVYHAMQILEFVAPMCRTIGAFRELAAIVRDELVPIIEMDDEANDPSKDLFIALHRVKVLLDATATSTVEPSK